jgi:uncharacterized protein (TIGR03083 family)
MGCSMRTERFLELLDDDFRRLQATASGDLDAKVPTCPEWTLADLLDHVSMVYLHKAETMRHNAFPHPWPPEERAPETPSALLARAYAELTAEFARRSPESPVPTWYEPDQTVGFWIRRMAHETVIHRVDGELAAGLTPAGIPSDLALDGIDEILRAFLAYASVAWHAEFAEALAGTTGETVLISTGGRGWMVRLRPEAVAVEQADPEAAADATVTGEPSGVLLWLWRRAGDSAVTALGDPGVSGKLHDILRIATQ